jgi:peptidoglycan/LPS O-acetylase OafA/YrhL
MFYHFTGSNGGLDLAPHRPLFRLSWMAVDFFFILSGFVIAHSYWQRLVDGMKPIEYVKRRFIRLYPLYFIALAFGFLLSWLPGFARYTNMSLGESIKGFALNILWLPYVFHNSTVLTLGTTASDFSHPAGFFFPFNPPAWSLFYEMLASIAFLLIIRLGRKTLIATSSVSFVVLTLFSLATSRAHGYHSLMEPFGVIGGLSGFVGGFFRVFFGYTLGVILYKSIGEGWTPRLFQWLRSSNLNFLYLLLFVALACPASINGLIPIFFMLLLAPALIVSGAKIAHLGPRATWFADWLGYLSYPVYCLHQPIGRVALFFGDKFHWTQSAMVMIAILATFVLSILVCKLLEEPVRRWLSSSLLERSKA